MRAPLTALFALLCSGATAAQADVPRVVTDIAPVDALVRSVLGDLGTPDLLLPSGASAHHFQMRPSQVIALQDADLVVMVGPELTLWLEKPLAGRPDAARTLALLHSAGTKLRDYTEAEPQGEADHDAHHDDDHEDHDHDDHEDAHSHLGLDPHAWLNPENAQAWLTAIAEELAALDPENAATYHQNAAQAQAAIAAADARARSTLAPFAGQSVLTQHDAFGYFFDHYGLAPALSVAAGDAATPGAKHLSELEAQLANHQLHCLFPEAGLDAAALTRLAEVGGGVTIGAPLDPLGATLPLGPDLYANLLLENAETLANCLRD